MSLNFQHVALQSQVFVAYSYATHSALELMLGPYHIVLVLPTSIMIYYVVYRVRKFNFKLIIICISLILVSINILISFLCFFFFFSSFVSFLFFQLLWFCATFAAQRGLSTVARFSPACLIQCQFLRTLESDTCPGSRARMGLSSGWLSECDNDASTGRSVGELNVGWAETTQWFVAAARVSCAYHFVVVLHVLFWWWWIISLCLTHTHTHTHRHRHSYRLHVHHILWESFVCKLLYKINICSSVLLATQRSYGWSRFSAASGLPTQPPPPPYQAPQQQQQQQTQQAQQQQPQQLPQGYALNGPVSLSAGGYATLQPQPQVTQCLLHRSLNCGCLHSARDVSVAIRSVSRPLCYNLNCSPLQGLSPNSVTTTMSPAYPNSEPSSDSLNTYSNVLLDGASDNAALLVQQQQQQQQRQQLAAGLEGKLVTVLQGIISL